MDILNDKKKHETVILELFRDLYPDFPKGVLKASESPDFILSLGPRHKIGIELTRLNLNQPYSDLFSFENISACLSSKDEKLGLYKRKRLQEYWLILYVWDITIKPRYNLHNKLINWCFGTGFNRVFLFYMAEGHLFELNTS